MQRNLNRLAIVLILVIILLLSVIPWLSLHLWWNTIEQALEQGSNRVVEDSWQREYAIRLDDFVRSRTGDLIYAAPIRVAEELRTQDTTPRQHGFMISVATFVQLVIMWQIAAAIYRFWTTRDTPHTVLPQVETGGERDDS
jgi:hypothetical protein